MSKRILIVDDDPVQRRLLKAAAEKAGYEIEVLTEGRSALARLIEPDHDIGAVVLDLMMPEMGGLEVLERLSAAGSTVPVIVQTGQGESKPWSRRCAPEPSILSSSRCRLNG